MPRVQPVSTMMTDAFDLRGTGPALVSFSGGKTSAYMTHRILEHGLDDDQYVVFSDTGMEREETHRFVDNCEKVWGVQIHRLRRTWDEPLTEEQRAKAAYFDGMLESPLIRKGELSAFTELLVRKNYLPSGGIRFCTTELKIRVMKRFMLDQGHDYWDMVVGIRADEPKRYHKLAQPQRERWENFMPLYEEGVELPTIEAFWSEQPFRLELLPHEGNCTLCHLKRADAIMRMIVEQPDFADWWAAWEEETGKQFRKGRSYEEIAEEAHKRYARDDRDGRAHHRQTGLFEIYDEGPSISCLCGD